MKTMIILLTVLGSTAFADDNKEVNHIFKEDSIKYKYVMEDFKEGELVHSLASKVHGNHYFKGSSPGSNFGERSRTCDLNVNGGFYQTLTFDNENLPSINKRLDRDGFDYMFRDHDNVDELGPIYEALEMGESYTNLRCDKSILWLNQSLLARQFPLREAKVSHLFDEFKNLYRLDPRKTYGNVGQNLDIFFLYPKIELSPEELVIYKENEASTIYNRVLKRNPDEYEMSVAVESETTETWGELLQNDLVSKRAGDNEDRVVESFDRMKSEVDNLYEDSEEFWLDVCLKAIRAFEELERKCNSDNDRVTRVFEEMGGSSSSAISELERALKPSCSDVMISKFNTPSKGEKCHRMISTGKFGYGKKKKLKKLDERFVSLNDAESNLKSNLETEFDELLHLVRPQSALYDSLLGQKSDLIARVPYTGGLHQLFLTTDPVDFSHLRLLDHETLNPIRPVVNPLNPLNPDGPIIPHIPNPEPGCDPIWIPDFLSTYKK